MGSVIDRAELYAYRAAWKQGLFEAFKDHEWTPFTLTFSDEALETVYSEEGARLRADAWMAAEGVAGFVVVERTREGRLHLHGMAYRDTRKLGAALDAWRRKQGFVHLGVGTDLLGWIQYLCKAFGPESVFIWRKEAKDGLGFKV